MGGVQLVSGGSTTGCSLLFSRCIGVYGYTLLTTSLLSFACILPLADCLNEEMSLYFASSIDFISLAMPTLNKDDEAVDAVMGDQDEVTTLDPMSLGDQLALRDAEAGDKIVVSNCVSSALFLAVAAHGCGPSLQ